MKRRFKWLVVLAAVALSGLPNAAKAGSADGQTLFLFNWSDYIPDSLIKGFEAKYGVKVVQSNYGSNAELQAKLQVGGDAEYDVIVPSGSFLPYLIRPGLLQKLDHAEIPNAGNLLPAFQNPAYDPGNTYSMPYQWGTTGIAYTTKDLNNPPASWAILFDPKANPNYPFELMGEDGRVIVGAACAYLGYGFDCTQKSQWLAAAKLIRQTMKRPNFTGFVDGGTALGQLQHGTVNVSMVFNGNFAACQGDGTCKSATYILPQEGTELWTDTMAIPARAPHPKLANEFINFILDAHSGADLSNYNDYASPNAASIPYLDPVLKARLISPTAEDMKHLVVLTPLAGPQYKLFNQIWTDIRR